MGVKDIWDIIPNKYNEYIPLSVFASQFARAHNRYPVLAVDAYTWYFETKNGAPAHRTRVFFDRLCAFRRCGIHLIMVFDGLAKRPKRRWHPAARALVHDPHREIDRYYKKMCRLLGIPVVAAPAEGEAECARFAAAGVADFVFTNDSDALVYGARNIIRYPKNNVWVQAAPGHTPRRLEEARLSSYDRYVCVTRIPPQDSTFSQPAFIMYALLQGGDHDDGPRGIGTVHAYEISFPPTRFANRLMDIYHAHTLTAAQSALPSPAAAEQLKRDILIELQENRLGLFRRKISRPVAAQYVAAFPNWETVAQYLAVSTQVAALGQDAAKAQEIQTQIAAYHAPLPASPPIDINEICTFCLTTLEFPPVRVLNSIIPTLLPYIASHDSKLLQIKSKKSYRDASTSSFFRSGEIITSGSSASCTRAQKSPSHSSFYDDSDIKLNLALPDYYNIVLIPSELFKALALNVDALVQSNPDFARVIHTPWRNIVPEHVLRACKYGYIAEHEAKQTPGEQATKLKPMRNTGAAPKRILKTSRVLKNTPRAPFVEPCYGENSDTDEDIFGPSTRTCPPSSKTNFIKSKSFPQPSPTLSSKIPPRSSFIDLTEDVLDAPGFQPSLPSSSTSVSNSRLNEVISLDTDDSEEDLFLASVAKNHPAEVHPRSREAWSAIKLDSGDQTDFWNDDTDVEIIEPVSFKAGSSNDLTSSSSKTDPLQTLYQEDPICEKALTKKNPDTNMDSVQINESQYTLIDYDVINSTDHNPTIPPCTVLQGNQRLHAYPANSTSCQTLANNDQSITSIIKSTNSHKGLKRKSTQETQDVALAPASKRPALAGKHLTSVFYANGPSLATLGPFSSQPQYPDLSLVHEKGLNEQCVGNDNLNESMQNAPTQPPSDKVSSAADLLEESLSSSDFEILEQEMARTVQVATLQKPSPVEIRSLRNGEPPSTEKLLHSPKFAPQSCSANEQLIKFGNVFIREEEIAMSDMEASFSVLDPAHTVSKTVHEIIELLSEEEN